MKTHMNDLRGGKRTLRFGAITTLSLLSWVSVYAASGSFSIGASPLFPSTNLIGLESWADGVGNHVSPWVAIMDNNHVVYVSPTPTSPTSFVSYGVCSTANGFLENIICTAAGKPVVYAVPTPSVTHQVYYYDTATSSFKFSFIPSPTNAAVNINNTQQGSYVGAMTNDIHGNIVLEILSYVWKSYDDGKTFVYVTDTATYIQPAAPNNFTLGNIITTAPAYGTNAPVIQGIAGAPYGGSTAPWGEMYFGKEFYNWRSYDDGQTWELIDPLWYQPMRETTTGLPWYHNNCLSYAMFGKGDGAAYTTDADVMINAFRVASYVNSQYPKYFRILPTGQIIHATNGDLDPVSSTYLTNGYTLSQAAGVGLLTTKSGDTYGSIAWSALPAGNPLNRNKNEIVKWDCDTKLWSIISPPAGNLPNGLGSYTFASAASDGDHYFVANGVPYQWTSNPGNNLRPDVTVKPVAGNFPLIVATDPNTHIASIIPGNSFNVSDDHTLNANLIYSWSFRGQGRVTFDNSSLFGATAYFSNPGFYILTLTVNDGSLSGAMSITVKVLPPASGAGTAPFIAVAGQPVNQVLTLGQPVVISLTATGTNLKYQWKRNGMEIVDTVPGTTSYILQGQTLDYSGTSANTLNIAAGRFVDDGAVYYCEVSNELGRVVSNSATIGNAPAIIQGPVDNSTSNGDLSVSTSGTQPLQWQWYFGTPGSGSKIAGAQSSIYHATNPGAYYVVVTNIFGSVTSASAQIGSFAGNSITFNLNGVNSNGTLAASGSATFLVGTQGSTIGIGTDAGQNWMYFTKWQTNNAHVTIAPGYSAQPHSKFLVDSTASGTISLTTNTTYFTKEYVFTVKNGFGTTSAHQYRFHAGDTLCIQAYTPPAGMNFNGWVVTKGGTLTGGFVANPGNGNSLTKFTFPNNDVELVATYAATNSYTIGGTIAASGNGLAGVSVALALNGFPTQTVQTIANGSYSFTPVADGSPYSVTPTKAGYTFAPANVAGTVNGGNAMVNFVGTSIQPPNIASVQVTPNPVTGTTATAQATATDPNIPAQTLSYSWSATGPAAVAFSPNNATSASNSTATFTLAGPYTITVTVYNASLNSTASTSVTVNQTLMSITVSPASANVLINNTYQFLATARDQFNAGMQPQPIFTWGIASGPGSVDTSGLYMAPASAGTASVKATSGAVSGSATVAINAKPVTPVLTWANPSNITYGTALSAAQLNATTTTPGSFVYTPASGTVLNAGNNQTLSVLFTPTDSVNYTTATATVMLPVLTKPLTATANAASRIYGTANPAFTGTLLGVVANDAITANYASNASGATAAGVYGITAAEVITPTLNDPNGRLANYSVSLTKAALTITPAIALIVLSKLVQAYDGTPKSIGIATIPANVKYGVTYNGSLASPAKGGSYPVAVTITDPNYAGSASGVLVIDQTLITSAATAFPNPSYVLQPILFSVAALNTNSSPLTFTWDFGDGLSGSGATATHSYSQAGTYHVVVSVDSGLAVVKDMVDVPISAPNGLIGEGLDSDGDGFSDSFEVFAGTDPASAASNPVGKIVTNTMIGTLTISKSQIKLNFLKPGSDSITLSGMVDVPNGFMPGDVLIDAGGVLKKLTLSHKGSAHVGGDSFKMSLKSKGTVTSIPFKAAFSKGSFADTLGLVSLLNNNTVSGSARTVTFAIVFNGSASIKKQSMLYTAKAGKSGLAK